MHYQVIDNETGKPMGDNCFVSQRGDIFLINNELGTVEQLSDRDRYTIRLTRTFRHSGLESKMVDDLSEYVDRQATQCFPDMERGSDIDKILREIIFDSFHGCIIFDVKFFDLSAGMHEPDTNSLQTTKLRFDIPYTDLFQYTTTIIVLNLYESESLLLNPMFLVHIYATVVYLTIPVKWCPIVIFLHLVHHQVSYLY